MKHLRWLTLFISLLTGCERAPDSTVTPQPVDSQTALSTPTTTTVPPAASPTAPNHTPVPPLSNESYTRALALKKEGNLAEARTMLQPLADGENPPDAILDLLSEINTTVIFTPVPAPEKVDYTIESGDSLGKLAKKFNTTIELIKKSNNLKSDMIRLGDRLRIYQGQFTVRVSKTANTLTVLDNNKFFKRYRVGTGEYSKTPVGTFTVTDRIASPPWYRGDKVIPYGDKENILGTHWLGLDIRGYGIHGTWDPNAIGKQATAGCVRLLNDHVEELYVILPTGTQVTIHE
jgi:lipoprotein-anchoring transpeptidase ErfK/SrfK